MNFAKIYEAYIACLNERQLSRTGGAQSRAVRPSFVRLGSCVPNEASDELRPIVIPVLIVRQSL
jgi:hypothetical protein